MDTRTVEYAKTLDPLTLAIESNKNQANMALMMQTFEILFEHLLVRAVHGDSLRRVVREYHTPVDEGRFRLWVYKDKTRKDLYTKYRLIGLKAIEDEMVDIADGKNVDGSDSLDDVPRSQTKLTTRQFILKVNDRKFYGDSKHVDVTTTTTVDTSKLSLSELKMRLLKAEGMIEDGEIIEG